MSKICQFFIRVHRINQSINQSLGRNSVNLKILERDSYNCNISMTCELVSLRRVHLQMRRSVLRARVGRLLTDSVFGGDGGRARDAVASHVGRWRRVHRFSCVNVMRENRVDSSHRCRSWHGTVVEGLHGRTETRNKNSFISSSINRLDTRLRHNNV